MSITAEQIEWLKGQVPEGVNPTSWAQEIRVFESRMPFVHVGQASRHILRALFDAAKRREAAAKGKIPGPEGFPPGSWDTVVSLLQIYAGRTKGEQGDCIYFDPKTAAHILAALAYYGSEHAATPKPAEQPKGGAAHLEGEIPGPEEDVKSGHWQTVIHLLREGAAEKAREDGDYIYFTPAECRHTLAALAGHDAKPKPEPAPDLVKAGDELAAKAKDVMCAVRHYGVFKACDWEAFIKTRFRDVDKALAGWDEAKGGKPDA